MAVLSTYHIDLVENNHIGKLNLVYHQVTDGTLIFGNHIVSSGRQEVGGFEIVKQCKSINDRAGSV